MIITLLTDFGDADGYVGAMKGVIAGLAPEARVIDIAHHLAPGDIRAASEILAETAPCFPPETIHVVVVDPTVGGDRRAVAVATDQRLLVGPDNGVLPPATAGSASLRAVVLDQPAFRRRPVSDTFWGRDVFAPTAAHLARGVPLSSLGSPVEVGSLARLPEPRVVRDEAGLEGEVVRFDRFGNAVCSLTREALGELDSDWTRLVVAIAGVEPAVARYYAAVEAGRPLALIGSHGKLEIAVRDGDARRALALTAGMTVRVRRR